MGAAILRGEFPQESQACGRACFYLEEEGMHKWPTHPRLAYGPGRGYYSHTWHEEDQVSRGELGCFEGEVDEGGGTGDQRAG